jgi:transposase
VLEAIGFALGGRPAARLLPPLALRQSPQTLLRLVRAAPEPGRPAPRVLGIDDWALKRGRTYGTLLIDLERHCPVDVLPDRTAATAAAWLRSHGGPQGQIEVIARDRAGAYAEGARQGAPRATKVADRWHLLKNLGDAVERLLTRYHRALQDAARPLAGSQVAPLVPAAGASRAIAPTDPPPPPVRRHVQEQQARRARRLTRYEAVRALRAQGASMRAIAQQLGLARGTVHRYLRAETFPEQQPRPRRTLLTPFQPYLRARWEVGDRNAAVLWRDLRARGFTGGKTGVRDLVARWRAAAGEPAPTAPRLPAPAGPPTAPDAPRHSTREVTWLLLRRPEALDAAELAYLQALFAHHPALGVAHGLAQDFLTIVRQRQEQALAAWVAVATASALPELRSFATGLLRDWAAVRAALTEPWSSGQVEGQVNRLKVLKRQMYGRANVDLLRKRVLHRDNVDPEVHQMRL